MDILEAFEQLNALNEGVSKFKACRLDLFESGETNVLLIVGVPGSGKSTTAKEMAEKYDAKIISLDDSWLGGITLGDSKDDKPFKQYWLSKAFWKEFPKRKEEFDACIEFCKHSDWTNIAEFFEGADDIGKHSYYHDYIEFAFRYTKEHPNTKFIIEGVQLLDYDKKTGHTWKKQIGENPAMLLMTTSIADTVDNIIEREEDWGETPRPKGFARERTKIWKEEFDRFRKEFE